MERRERGSRAESRWKEAGVEQVVEISAGFAWHSKVPASPKTCKVRLLYKIEFVKWLEVLPVDFRGCGQVRQSLCSRWCIILQFGSNGFVRGRSSILLDVFEFDL